jgi:hypothetical protein
MLIIHSGEIARQYVQEFAARYNESGGKGSITSVEQISVSVPSQFTLLQNYPNPFNPTTVFSFYLPVSSKVKLTVYDLLGREVAKVVDEVKLPGLYKITWDASTLTSGVYFYKLEAGTFTAVKKAILLK